MYSMGLGLHHRLVEDDAHPAAEDIERRALLNIRLHDVRSPGRGHARPGAFFEGRPAELASLRRRKHERFVILVRAGGADEQRAGSCRASFSFIGRAVGGAGRQERGQEGDWQSFSSHDPTERLARCGAFRGRHEPANGCDMSGLQIWSFRYEAAE